jgi:hypothetical protein
MRLDLKNVTPRSTTPAAPTNDTEVGNTKVDPFQVTDVARIVELLLSPYS